MVTFKEATQALYRGLAPHGFVGRGRIWRLPGEDVHWAAEIEACRYGNSFTVDFGCVIVPGTPPPKSPNDCQIVIFTHVFSLDYDHDVLQVCDLGNELSDDYRLGALEELGDAVGRYVLAHQTIDALRVAYRNDEFRKCGIYHKARTLLEQDG